MTQTATNPKAGQVTPPKLKIKVKYGKQLDELEVNKFIEIDKGDRVRTLQYLKRKYQDRIYGSSHDTIGGVMRIFRLQ